MDGVERQQRWRQLGRHAAASDNGKMKQRRSGTAILQLCEMVVLPSSIVVFEG